MPNRTILMILLLCAAAAFAAAYHFFNKPVERFDWTDSRPRKAYSENNDEPYGARIFYTLLHDYFPGQKFEEIEEALPETLKKARGAYVFIGAGMGLDSLGAQSLVEFVARGNTALLISKSVPENLLEILRAPFCETEDRPGYGTVWLTDTARLSLSIPDESAQKAYRFFYADQNEAAEYRWRYLDEDVFCEDAPFAPLGRINDNQINFFAFWYGDGVFLVHTNPIAFSNFHLLRPEGRRYAEGVLSHLPEGPVYWDIVSRRQEASPNGRQANDRDFPDRHPLVFILKQPALAWAWYLLAGLAAAYLLFRAKRRQRVIPVLPKNENSSYEFISTIANLHFLDKNCRGICIESMKLFVAQLRERYGLALTLDPKTQLPRLDDDQVQRLARITETPETQIRALFTQYRNAIQYETTEQMMVDLHLAIERFLKTAK